LSSSITKINSHTKIEREKEESNSKARHSLLQNNQNPHYHTHILEKSKSITSNKLITKETAQNPLFSLNPIQTIVHTIHENSSSLSRSPIGINSKLHNKESSTSSIHKQNTEIDQSKKTPFGMG
jgi:hypothetical protein